MTSSKPSRRRGPTARDRKIIQHVDRYRLTTIEVLSRVVVPGLSSNALSKIANRLCDAGYLRKYTLLHPTRYFVLGEAGANLLGSGNHRVAPLGPQSLPTECGVLFYATLGNTVRLRLIPAEVEKICPWLTPRLAEAPHCTDQSQGVLELIRVDLGGPADHVARKCAMAVNERRRLREFSGFVAQGRFRLVVITMTKEKAAAVRQALDHHDWPTGLLIHLSIVPQLLPLTASRPNA
jgi:hypothetical protein